MGRGGRRPRSEPRRRPRRQPHHQGLRLPGRSGLPAAHPEVRPGRRRVLSGRGRLPRQRHRRQGAELRQHRAIEQGNLHKPRAPVGRGLRLLRRRRQLHRVHRRRDRRKGRPRRLLRGLQRLRRKRRDQPQVRVQLRPLPQRRQARPRLRDRVLRPDLRGLQRPVRRPRPHHGRRRSADRGADDGARRPPRRRGRGLGEGDLRHRHPLHQRLPLRHRPADARLLRLRQALVRSQGIRPLVPVQPPVAGFGRGIRPGPRAPPRRSRARRLQLRRLGDRPPRGARHPRGRVRFQRRRRGGLVRKRHRRPHSSAPSPNDDGI
mmetsp:Transcript_27948/g.65728  ORF Transcript_27948/g.65728 Transcript_27948/m.65728 type:complete len:319 (-) Transcript_27948:47-1003(-)